ncbi:hypothetical protein [Mycolicibacterium sp.]|uniref:hypothetical protein n=1 Tax=Mycolicibacterium sp. TaxID=2320850 RepID=UPI003D147813
MCEDAGSAPADMAVTAGKAALTAADVAAGEVRWVIHAGSGPQGSQGWPVHHHIQNGIVGPHGNAFEVRQNCAGGLTTWLLGSRLTEEGAPSICTGADNWSWSDRFATAREYGGEPMSDAAHAVVMSHTGGFGRILASATASYPELSEDWRTRKAYWEATDADDFRRAYARATTRTLDSARTSFRMFARAVTCALAQAQVSSQYVTHFVPPGSGSGEPYRLLSKSVGLPWSEALHSHYLDIGYLGVSTQAEGIAYLAEIGALKKDSIVLLLAAEYQLSATALLLRVTRPPRVVANGRVRVVA